MALVTAPYVKSNVISNPSGYSANAGFVTIAYAATPSFRVGAQCWLNATGLTPLPVQVMTMVNDPVNGTTMQVQIITNNVSSLSYGGSNVSTYTGGTSPTLTQPQQQLSDHGYAVVQYILDPVTGNIVPLT
jgi:Na+/H+-translocating membrane pyrophosphatase